MAERVRQFTLGLNTDLPPDKLGERALRTMNVAPASEVSMAPRAGTTLVGHYAGQTLGRQLVIDALPQRSDRRLLVLAVNTRDVDGALRSAVEGLADYAPKFVGGSTSQAICAPGTSPWGESEGDPSEYLYGWLF